MLDSLSKSKWRTKKNLNMENSEVSLEHEESTCFKRKTPAPPSVIHLAMIYWFGSSNKY